MNSIIRLQKYSVMGVLISVLILLSGCSDNDVSGPGENPGTNNLMETIKSDAGLTILEELLEGTSLKTILESNGDITVFAPTDAAFQKLPAGYLESLNIDQKKSLLEYHAFQGSYRIINEIKKEAIVTMQGDPLFLEIGQSFGNLINNRSRFVKNNTEADNGILHTIDEVLIPDQMGTLFDNIHKRYEYKNFAARLETAELGDMLKAPGTKTLLTTSDIALDRYESVENMNLSDAEWKEIMQYHVIAMDITGTGPGTKIALPTVHQDSVYLVVDQPGEFLINGGGGSPVQQVLSTNGKIVLPSGIMLPDKFLGVL
ncbi:MAG: fasciclin domain-containing protein, partial [Balneolaceae bacterium]|nr:fasciclin domain-containing protein [Balneolaceae bacterium]